MNIDNVKWEWEDTCGFTVSFAHIDEMNELLSDDDDVVNEPQGFVARLINKLFK